MGTESDPRDDDSSLNDLKTLILDSEYFLNVFGMVQNSFGYKVSRISHYVARMGDLSLLNNSGCKWLKKESDSRSLEIRTSMNQDRSEEFIERLMKHSSMLNDIEERAVSVLRKRMNWLKEFSSKIESHCEMLDKFYDELSDQVTNDLGSEELQLSTLYKEFYVEKEKYMEALIPARTPSEPSSSTKLQLNSFITSTAATSTSNRIPYITSNAEDKSAYSMIDVACQSVRKVFSAVLGSGSGSSSSSSSSSSSIRPNDTGYTDRSATARLQDSNISNINCNPTGRTSAIMKNLDQSNYSDSDKEVEIEDKNGSAKKYGNSAVTVIGDMIVKSHEEVITLDIGSEDDEEILEKNNSRSNAVKENSIQSSIACEVFSKYECNEKDNEKAGCPRALNDDDDYDNDMISSEVNKEMCRNEITGDNIEYPTKKSNSSASSNSNSQNNSNNNSNSDNNNNGDSNRSNGVDLNYKDYNDGEASNSTNDSSSSSSRSSSCRTIDETGLLEIEDSHLPPQPLFKYAQGMSALPLQYTAKANSNSNVNVNVKSNVKVLDQTGGESDDDAVVIVCKKDYITTNGLLDSWSRNSNNNDNNSNYRSNNNQVEYLDGYNRGGGERGRGSTNGTEINRIRQQNNYDDNNNNDDYHHENNLYNLPKSNKSNGSSSSTCSLQNSNVDIGNGNAKGVKRKAQGSKYVKKANPLDQTNEKKKRRKSTKKSEMDDFIVYEDEDDELSDEEAETVSQGEGNDEAYGEVEERKRKKARKSNDSNKGGKRKSGGKYSNNENGIDVTVDLTDP